uniref:Ubiquitin-like protease family profile domain-containing protein n=1 Tax=Lactuca sativa TaxID=4236 RepID=A0A9R1VGI9_LACSA|nr:hypothetical protein LSAT_V11C500255050 [Lactuca sativa]
MPTPCELVLPYGELDQKCAKGLVFPYGNGLIHTLPLRENHLKVMIDDIDSRYENLPLRVMTKEVANLQGAVGTVIQWPRIAIILAKEQRAKKQIPTTSLEPTIARAGTNKNIPNQTSSKARPIEYLRDCLKTNQVVNIVSDSGILEVGTYDFSDSSFNGEAFQKNPEGVVSYLVDSIRLHHGKLFLIAPYLQNKHWVLLVISLRNRIVYILDSLKDRIENSADHHYLLKKTCGHCNQQLGSFESGHYSGSIWDNKSLFEEKGG